GVGLLRGTLRSRAPHRPAGALRIPHAHLPPHRSLTYSPPYSTAQPFRFKPPAVLQIQNRRL
ncbi:hypothetical protein, partial [Schleiferia thermophila]